MKTIKRWLALGAMLAGLAGCATDPATVGLLAQTQLEAAKVPTLVVDCPSGCNVRYTDPRDRGQVRLPTNGYDAAVAVSGQVTGLLAGAVPYAALGAVAAQGMKRAGGNDQSVSTATTTNTASGAGASTGGAASYRSDQIGPNSQNPTSTTTTTTDNSVTATATPTVVMQPTPVIVTQPAPIVVTP